MSITRRSDHEPGQENLSKQPFLWCSGAQRGITFELRSGCQRFGPLAFLSWVDFNSPNEIVFYYPNRTVILRGTGLIPIWDCVQKGNLALVRESPENSDHQTRIDTIVIQEPEAEKELRFPAKPWT